MGTLLIQNYGVFFALFVLFLLWFFL